MFQHSHLEAIGIRDGAVEFSFDTLETQQGIRALLNEFQTDAHRIA